MNSKRGYWQMPPVNAGLHHKGMGTLLNAKLKPQVRRKVLLEAHKYRAWEALVDGIIDAAEEPEKMFEVALELADKWKSKAKMGVYALLRGELVGDALTAYREVSYVHGRDTSREPKVKL
jgi:enoyl-CoA hydratase/carnithine racemase